MHQSAGLERAPFRRQLNFWAFSLAAALAEDLEPLGSPSSNWGKKFIDTREVEMPDTLCDLLAIVAFHHLGAEHEEIDNPTQIIEVANCFAGAGCSLVLEHLNSKDLRLTPLDKLLDLAASLYNKTTSI